MNPTWKASDVRDSRTWTYPLSPDEQRDIVNATAHARARGVTIENIGRDDFPLTTLAPAVARWISDIATGLGFVLVRDFPIDQLSADDVELAYAGLGAHLGTLVRQNSGSEILTHIRDDRTKQEGQIIRLYRTNERQDFHTDAADIIGLLCLHKAKSGGESKIVNSRALYDEMMRRRPDLVDELTAVMYWDRQNEHKEGELPWFQLAPLTVFNGEPRLFYVGWYIRNAQRHADVPRLTAAQEEAMQLLESLANDPKFHLEMEFEPGDIQLLNNGRILHAREAYEDWDDPDQRRHLLRLWLAAHDFVSLEDELRVGVNNK